jgi:hypothetical protein
MIILYKTESIDILKYELDVSSTPPMHLHAAKVF